MLEEFNSRQEFVHYLEDLPAEQAKQLFLYILISQEDLSTLLGTSSLFAVEQEQEIDQQQLSPTERAKAFRAWAESHENIIPVLSDEAMSRESIYSNELL